MIEFENVSFAYEGQGHDDLHGISLQIADGECILFCGRSGCGKTTTTRLVNGLIPQFYQGELRGRVLVDGQEISDLPMYQIAARVGSVFQNPRTQFFNVDTDSEIAFGIENEARPVQELEERVEQTTKDLHIEQLRGRNIFELSGGEKQELRDVTLRYQKHTILRKIALSAAKGEVIGVVGHNGAGKTTFSRVLCGLHKEYTGEFLWNGQPMEHKARLKRSYMVMQDVNYELFAESVEAECFFGIRNPNHDLVETTMAELGLTAYRERHPGTLSGGQK